MLNRPACGDICTLEMNLSKGSWVFAVLLLAGCGATRDVANTSYNMTRGAAVGSYKVARAVAVGSYHVASAPVRYATGRGHNEPVMVGTTDAVPSDVTQPGQPIPSAQNGSASQRHGTRQSESSRGSGRTAPQTDRTETTQVNGRTPARPSSPPSEFPTAKAVPDKSGYVFSPFDSSGRYVDVSGYPPGTKVKDPWTDKIFIVP
jgi:hypothetical protein